MSRNLLRLDCAFCRGEVKKVGPDRPVTIEDVFECYWDEYQGMVVADAACVECEAPYLAWLDGSKRKTQYVHGFGFNYPDPIRYDDVGLIIRDLSHKHAFNDEPAYEDYPKWKMVPSREPWPKCLSCDAPMSEHGRYCSRDYNHKAPTP